MTELCLSVSWKDHSCELATLCKMFLENNYLVDCSISAEGQCLKAHRLVLSACSPYFHMLFNDESEKYPIVVLLDASFETVKAVIDFVYCGEVQIPQGNLKAFLALAQDLQIKGLNAFIEKDGNKCLSGSSGGNVFSRPSEDKQDNYEVQGSSAAPEDSINDHSLFFSDGSPNEQTSCFVPFEGCSDTLENVESGSVVPPLPEQHILPDCDELAVDTAITVKHEPLFSVFSEAKQDLLDDVKNDEPKPDNLPSELEKETASVIDHQDLNQFSSIGEISCGHVESATAESPPHLLKEQQQQKQPHPQNCQLQDEYPASRVAEQPQQLLPATLILKSELLSDGECEESMETHDDKREADEKTQLAASFSASLSAACRQIFNRSSNSGGRFTLLDQATKRRERQKQQRPHQCSFCHKTFSKTSHLQKHVRIHTGERPFICTLCHAAFTQSFHLNRHKRSHTGERPYKCSECGVSFIRSGHLITHKRCHTGERPYACNVCGKAFTQSQNLDAHKRNHTGERPFKCSECGVSFKSSGNLTKHKRTHTGQRPFKCSECSASFTTLGNLTRHQRNHTSERPYSCDDCGRTFARTWELADHKRIKSAPRPFVCDACSKGFITRRALVKHLRRSHPVS